MGKRELKTEKEKKKSYCSKELVKRGS